jgi:hypothetical protein
VTNMFVRNRTGKIVHRVECPHARTAPLPDGPDKFVNGDVPAALAQHHWLKVCQRCRPDLPEWPQCSMCTDRAHHARGSIRFCGKHFRATQRRAVRP